MRDKREYIMTFIRTNISKHEYFWETFILLSLYIVVASINK